MKMRSKIVTCLVLALSISCLATGCKKKAQETGDEQRNDSCYRETDRERNSKESYKYIHNI